MAEKKGRRHTTWLGKSGGSGKRGVQFDRLRMKRKVSSVKTRSRRMNPTQTKARQNPT